MLVDSAHDGDLDAWEAIDDVVGVAMMRLRWRAAGNVMRRQRGWSPAPGVSETISLDEWKAARLAGSERPAATTRGVVASPPPPRPGAMSADAGAGVAKLNGKRAGAEAPAEFREETPKEGKHGIAKRQSDAAVSRRGLTVTPEARSGPGPG